MVFRGQIPRDTEHTAQDWHLWIKVGANEDFPSASPEEEQLRLPHGAWDPGLVNQMSKAPWAKAGVSQQALTHLLFPSASTYLLPLLTPDVPPPSLMLASILPLSSLLPLWHIILS